MRTESISKENLNGKPNIHSEKHDVLYSKARSCLNQRYNKRPLFKPNPYFENIHQSVDLENFLPSEKTFIQQPESLVVCENFHIDHPVDTRTFTIDSFFSYLNSDKWSKGCSIRVLNGKLLDQLLMGLYRLQREGIVVRHTTYAFAMNNRPNISYYKSVEQNSRGSIEETLLLEFAYFGRLTKETSDTGIVDPLEYLPHESDELKLAETGEYNPETVTTVTTIQDTSGNRMGRAGRYQIPGADTSRGSLTNQNMTDNKPRRGLHGSLMSKHVQAFSFLKAIQSGQRPQSISASSNQPENIRTDNIDKHEDKCRPKERDIFYGEEFYLSDQMRVVDIWTSMEHKLQQQKNDLQERREEAKLLRHIQHLKAGEVKLPTLPPIDQATLDSHRVKHKAIDMPDDVPTFEEFIELLKADAYYDRRYRNNASMKVRINVQRYHTANKSPNKQKLYVGGVSSIGNTSQLRTIHESITCRNTLVLPDVKRISSTASIHSHSREVRAVTDSELCQDHYLKTKGVFPNRKERKNPPSTCNETVNPIFKKQVMCDDEVESTDTESSDSEAEKEHVGMFNTKKLNMKYIDEQLRKKGTAKPKMKPTLIQISAKYDSVKNYLSAFRKVRADKETNRSRTRAKQPDRKNIAEKETREQNMVIGKLMAFDFLKEKPAEKLNVNNVSHGDFTAPDLAQFHEMLNKALDNYVVRREIVVSDLQTFYNASTSVTFTKHSCFQTNRKTCEYKFY